MARYLDTVWCDGCGAEITISPVPAGAQVYCCQDCLDGRGCNCSERMIFDDERREKDALPSVLTYIYHSGDSS